MRTPPDSPLEQLPIDLDAPHESQLMSDAELEPEEVQGDRFDPGNDDLGTAPDLEPDPGAPDLEPTLVGRFEDPAAAGEPDPDEVEDRLTARPRASAPEAWVDAPEPNDG